MKNKRSGFTIIELMIAVAIIGVLSAVAIPAYKNYIIRSKVSEAITMSSKYQTEVSECYQNLSTLTDCDSMKHEVGENQVGKYGAVSVTDGIITYTFNASGVADELNSKAVVFTPNVTGVNNSVNFVCSSNVDSSYLPSSCRVEDIASSSGGTVVNSDPLAASNLPSGASICSFAPTVSYSGCSSNGEGYTISFTNSGISNQFAMLVGAAGLDIVKNDPNNTSVTGPTDLTQAELDGITVNTNGNPTVAAPTVSNYCPSGTTLKKLVVDVANGPQPGPRTMLICA